MKTLLENILGGVLTTLLLYIIVNPDNGILYENAAMPFGLGLIGLGLCLHSRKRPVHAVVKTRVQQRNL